MTRAALFRGSPLLALAAALVALALFLVSDGAPPAQAETNSNQVLTGLEVDVSFPGLGWTSGTLDPAFDSATKNYGVTFIAPAGAIPTQVRVRATWNSAHIGEVKVGKFTASGGLSLTNLAHNTYSSTFSLDKGQNTITVRPFTTTHSDDVHGSGLKHGAGDYDITIVRSHGSPDATLSALAASSATSATGAFSTLTLAPAFDADTTFYTATAANNATHVKLTPTVNETNATVKVGKRGGDLESVTSGSASDAIALGSYQTEVNVEVTAQDENTKRYTVVVTRERLSSNANLSALTASSATSATGAFSALTLSPAFDAARTTVLQYRAQVANDVSHVKLTPTVDDTGKATVKVGKRGGTLASVTSGSASGAISLDAGDNYIRVEVTAEDESTKRYTVVVTRRAGGL